VDNQVFFKNANSFRDWLRINHRHEKVLWVCYYKKHTKKASLTWDESVAEALCFGWIDGLRKSIDEESYRIRFTPRKKNSIWSKKNIETVGRLIVQKRMMKSGLKAFEYRKDHKSSIYTYEKENLELSKEFSNALKHDKSAWAYYKNLAPSFKKQSVNWIMSAKKQETRDRRFTILLESCQNAKLVPALQWTKKEVKS
jgi:uncharacterized protein YdeI (YjbR/CyaY-like superfamily)